ncbi:STM3941 family protein [Sphingobacterium sp. LRF_L2]|uniref:STM3941 family protein n=1 Tax=Sphingobacterium sp. LRF_L2 TaxID=3369421 RepID=UPI003F5DF432
MKEEIQLYRDVRKSKNLFLKTTGICVVLAATLIYGLGVFDHVLKVKLVVGSALILAIMLFLLINALLKLRDKSPLIRINSNYIVGNTTLLSKAFGEIEWSDVEDIHLEKVAGDTLVVFYS